MNLTIVAQFEANANHIDFAKTELIKLIEPTLKEEGCIHYDLHHDNDNPALFLFYENWLNRELWQKHINSSHIAEFKRKTENIFIKANIYEMSQLHF